MIIHEANCQNYCHTLFDTLHHAPSSAICRAAADTRDLGIPSELISNITGFMCHCFPTKIVFLSDSMQLGRVRRQLLMVSVLMKVKSPDTQAQSDSD